jgi:hypothetical protein
VAVFEKWFSSVAFVGAWKAAELFYPESRKMGDKRSSTRVGNSNPCGVSCFQLTVQSYQ